MTLKQCQLIALDAVRELKIPLSETVLDDGQYYIFSSADEIEDVMIGVDKETGEVIDYFPPKHPAYMTAAERVIS